MSIFPNSKKSEINNNNMFCLFSFHYFSHNTLSQHHGKISLRRMEESMNIAKINTPLELACSSRVDTPKTSVVNFGSSFFDDRHPTDTRSTPDRHPIDTRSTPDRHQELCNNGCRSGVGRVSVVKKKVKGQRSSVGRV